MTSCPRDGPEVCPSSCESYAARMDESGYWFLGGASSLAAFMLTLSTAQSEWWSILTIVVTFAGAAVMFTRGALDWRAARRQTAAGAQTPSS